MLLDQNLRFSNAQALTTTAASTNIYDQLLGLLVTSTFTPSPGDDWGNSTYFGEDLGIGQGKGTPRVIVTVGTALAGGTSVQVQFQGAPVNATAHASGNTSDLTFVTYMETDVMAAALLTAGARIASFAWPMRKVGNGLPRFVRLRYVIVGTFTSGNVSADVDLGGGDEAQRTLGQYPANYAVSA